MTSQTRHLASDAPEKAFVPTVADHVLSVTI